MEVDTLGQTQKRDGFKIFSCLEMDFHLEARLREFCDTCKTALQTSGSCLHCNLVSVLPVTLHHLQQIMNY